MEKNRENCMALANRIYDMDAEVYRLVGSSLGRTFSEDRKGSVEELTLKLLTNPEGHVLRSEIALIGNMARTIRDREKREKMLKEYHDIREEIAQIPQGFGSVDIGDEDLVKLNYSNLTNKFSENDHLIICIGRSHGSAGTDIGFALADSLKINYYDEEVLNDMLKRREAEQNVGRKQGKLYELSKNHGLSSRDASFFRQSELIGELARKEDMIIMGRCADVILTNLHIPHISIFITAPIVTRVRHMMSLKQTDIKQALLGITKMDRQHDHYYRAYSGRRWGNANNYDLCINSACYGIEGSVKLIERMVGREQE